MYVQDVLLDVSSGSFCLQIIILSRPLNLAIHIINLIDTSPDELISMKNITRVSF